MNFYYVVCDTKNFSANRFYRLACLSRFTNIAYIAIFIFALFQAHIIIAAEVDGLYHSQAIVTGTEEPERTRGFGEALKNVIVKLTGDAGLQQDHRLAALLAEPHRFVESFDYEDRMKGIPLHDEEGTRKRPHFLRVSFAQPAIDAELERLDLRKWGSDRPLIGVWLNVRTASDKYTVRSDGPAGYGQRAVLMDTADLLGIPIILPAANENVLHLDDVTHFDFNKLNAALPETDALLFGNLSITTNGYWDIVWSLHTASTDRSWALQDVTFDEALKVGLTRSALTLSGNDP